MSIIMISRGSYSRGKEVAEKVAERLGYECVARDVLLEASKEFNVSEVKLDHALRDASSFFSRLSYGKERYVAYIRAALLEHLKRDKVVYHGLAGHFFVRDISHALKVRIIADMGERVRQVMQRDQVSERQAIRYLERVDKERRKWSQQLYGIDNTDPSLYDLVLHVHTLTVDDAVDVICHTAALPHLQATDESRKALDDDALASSVKAALVKTYPEIDVTAQDGVVFVSAKASEAEEFRMEQTIQDLTRDIPGVKEVKVQLHWFTPYGT